MGQRVHPPFPAADEDPAVLAPPTLPPQVGQAEVPGGYTHICILSTCAPTACWDLQGPPGPALKRSSLDISLLDFHPTPEPLGTLICLHLHTSACWFGEPSTRMKFTMSAVKSQTLFIANDFTPS